MKLNNSFFLFVLVFNQFLIKNIYTLYYQLSIDISTADGCVSILTSVMRLRNRCHFSRVRVCALQFFEMHNNPTGRSHEANSSQKPNSRACLEHLGDPKRALLPEPPVLAVSLSRQVQFRPAHPPPRVASPAKQYQQHYANETVPPARKRWNPIQDTTPSVAKTEIWLLSERVPR